MTSGKFDQRPGGSAPPPPLPLDGCTALAQRRWEVLPFAVLGTLYVVAGGLVAALTAPAPTEQGTWAAAYLVLVCGVAQAGLGLGQVLCVRQTPPPLLTAQLIGWNLGNAAVLVGTLTGDSTVVDVGGALLVVTLVLLGRGVTAPGPLRRSAASRSFRYGYGLLIAVLGVSIPVGLVLARLRT